VKTLNGGNPQGSALDQQVLRLNQQGELIDTWDRPISFTSSPPRKRKSDPLVRIGPYGPRTIFSPSEAGPSSPDLGTILPRSLPSTLAASFADLPSRHKFSVRKRRRRLGM